MSRRDKESRYGHEKESRREKRMWRRKRKRRRKQKQTKQCHTHTTTMGEEDNTEAVTVLISKMAAKHLTRVLFLSAFSSAISSSLSRSCSRQTFSSLVNTANSCGTHKLRSGAQKTNCLNVWCWQCKWRLLSRLSCDESLKEQIIIQARHSQTW